MTATADGPGSWGFEGSKVMKPWVRRGPTAIRNVVTVMSATVAVGPGSWGFEGLEVLMLRENGGAMLAREFAVGCRRPWGFMDLVVSTG